MAKSTLGAFTPQMAAGGQLSQLEQTLAKKQKPMKPSKKMGRQKAPKMSQGY